MNKSEDLSFLVNNLNLVNLPCSLWAIHVHPEFQYIGILHLDFSLNIISIDKAIIIKYNLKENKINSSIFLNQKNIKIPQMNSEISSINDVCNMIYFLHELKFCENHQQEKNCLIYVEKGFEKCGNCYQHEKWKIDEENDIWDSCNSVQINESLSETLIETDVDIVVKQILEMENIPSVDEQKIEYTCKICSKIFLNPASLNRHEKTHANENKKFICDICNKGYASQEILKKHTRSHMKERNFQCEICEKRFSNSSHLKVHFQKHSGERPFQCEFCTKAFYTKGHLKEHTRLHTNERPYKCPVCAKTNSHQSAHQRHVLTHNQDKPNLCNVCGKTFCKGYRMEDHMVTHSDQRPFSCEICQKTFAKAANLKLHKKTHTGVRPYECNICKKNLHNPK